MSRTHRHHFGIRLLAVLIPTLVWGCGSNDPARVDVTREIARGRAFAVRVQEASQVSTPAEVAPQHAIALGYLERLRLGLGSPFRVIEYALHDPRLADSVRIPLGWALLERVADGDAYQIDPAALDPAEPSVPGNGSLHLEIIEEAVEDAGDPRTAEASIRMAYALATAEGSVGSTAPALAARAVALLRDRELAADDARALIRAARKQRRSAVALVPTWRAERRFSVERPPLAPLVFEDQQRAVRALPRLTAAIRRVSLEGAEAREPVVSPPSLLSPAAADRLAALAEAFDYPPQTPVVATVRSYSEYLRRETVAARGPERVTESFVRRAVSEERFAAELTRLRLGGVRGTAPAVVALATATALRAYAQEPVWYVGFPAPSAQELRARYGLASLRFDRSVPEAWKPYYLRMLALSLGDLAAVFPQFSVRGVRIRIGSHGRSDALATHSPRTRTITLPPATGAGTIAHEVAHDLDYQAARARFRLRGTYATDRAVLLRRGSLAAALELLAPGPLDPTTTRSSNGERPAEVFARNVDWYVAVSLSRLGRSNGYLTSVQDEVLRGYGHVPPPELSGTVGEALLEILGVLTTLVPEDHRAFRSWYGVGRTPSALDHVRAVLDRPLRAEEAIGSWVAPAARAAAPSHPFGGFVPGGPRGSFRTEAECGPGWLRPSAEESALRTQVVRLAIQARARGLALDQAERSAGADGRRWMADRLYGTFRSSAGVDSTTAAVLEPLVLEVRSAGSEGAPAAAGACDPTPRRGGPNVFDGFPGELPSL